MNLGAGMDTRAFRLENYQAFTNGVFDIDMKEVNEPKAKLFMEFLGAPTAHCRVTTIDLDFLDTEKTLTTELITDKSPFLPSQPSLFVSEGLIMYLGVG